MQEVDMAVLQVRDIPDDVYLELNNRAKKEQRSITQEAIVLLKQANQLPRSRAARYERLVNSPTQIT
jgi:plasmid stability protein